MKSILPLRFVALVAHFVLVIVFLSNRDYNVRACIGWDYTEDQYSWKDTELVVGLALSVAFISLELVAFLAGISMLNAKQCLYSLCMHSLGSLSLLAFVLDAWECGLFWWIFALTVVGPMLAELYVVVRSMLLSGGGSHGSHPGSIRQR